jgi:drug/metabolite transporter (DMT)-like permease
MNRLDALALLLLASLWGASFLFMRIAAPVLGPIWLIELRVLLAGLSLLPLVLRSQLWPEIKCRWRTLAIVGGINSALPFSLLAFSAVSLPAGFTSILNATAPLFGAIVASVWLKEKLTGARLIGFLLGFTGIVVLVGWQTFTATAGFSVAVLAGLLAAIMYAIAAPFAKRNLVGVSPLAATAGSQLCAAVLFIPLLPFTMPQQMPSAIVIMAVIGLALLSTACAYLIYFRLIQSIGATKTLTVTYLIPIFAMLWGAIWLRETITPAMLIGCGLVLLGTAIANDLLIGTFKAIRKK